MTNSPSNNIKYSLESNIKHGMVYLKIHRGEDLWEEVDRWHFDLPFEGHSFALGYAEALNSMENTHAILLEVE